MERKTDRLILATDLAGTAVFAVEGAAAAIAGRLDLLGVLVLAVATALGGGMVRDVLIGAVPPQALRDWRYPALALAAGALSYALFATVRLLPGAELVALDAAGLSLFVVAGTEKALDHGLPALAATLLGAVTGVGGGVVRDVLLARVPVVLRSDIYATAALAGALALVIARRRGVSAPRAAILGAAVCFSLRMTAVALHWNLPGASGP